MNTHFLIEKAINAAGSQKALADRCRVSQAAVSKWLTKKNKPTIWHAIAIEQATDGEVTRYDLYPKFFGPDPAKTPHPEQEHAA